ncbi:MAG TPA: glycoside hydrolase family 2 TIM barrel-domain containing protein [Abditibacteriaceae bacterium]|jgi:beta-galactosidase/beta-glucuronidase
MKEEITVPRPEYPRPQWQRNDWLCLNGEWEFERDPGDSGHSRDLLARPLKERIIVPFCPESPLSGIGDPDFHPCVWYRRQVTIPANWQGRDAVLHFGAVDYDATVWVNGTEVGRHRGGFTPFSCPLRGVAKAGQSITIVVRARDDGREPKPRGKQSLAFAPYSCFYTRTTGIWQSVWLEALPRVHMKRPRVTPDVANGFFRLEVPISQNRSGYQLRARLRTGIDEQGKPVGEVLSQAQTRADLSMGLRVDLSVPDDAIRLWAPGEGNLYGIELELLNAEGEVVDSATTYGGLRSVALDGLKIKINGQSVFQRLVLDQGYYPDGVMTAPSDAALVQDIQLSLDAGFNGARLHQKVFEERFLFHADRMGYMVWGEFGDWGSNNHGPMSDHWRTGTTYAAQWLEVLERDYSHPAIIGWCPLNETAQILHDKITELDDATRAMFLACKAMDSTRPVLDASGYSHRIVESDVFDSHDYVYEPDFQIGMERFAERYAHMNEGQVWTNPLDYNHTTGDKLTQVNVWSLPWRGQPFFISEFGGFKWNPDTQVKSAYENQADRKGSWGYGSDPVSEDDLLARFKAQCDLLLGNPYMFAYCYTQLTDIFPEENGFYTFDRKPKFDIAAIHAIQTQPAAIETEEDRDDDTIADAALRRYARLMRHANAIDIAKEEESQAANPVPQSV